MSVSLWLDRTSSNSKKQFDVAVIGAGISGLSAAYWLAKKDPQLKIALIDRGRIAFGASGRNAGFITCGSVEHFNRLVGTHGLTEAHKIWQFSEDNLRRLKEEVIKDHHEDIGFEQKGSFSLASSEVEMDELRKTANYMRECKIPVEELNVEQIQKRVGAIEFVGGIKYVSDASVDPVKLCHRIYDLIKDQVTLMDYCEVASIETHGASNLIHTDHFEIECDLAILATNGYSAALEDYFTDKIFPTKGQIVAFEPVKPFMEGPCYANFVLDYFRQLPSGELIIGGFRQLEKETEVGYSDHTTKPIQEALHEFVRTYLPQFKDSKVTHRWGGIMGFSADGQPMIGSLPNKPQVFFVGGHTAHGIGLAFNCGYHLANLIFGEEIPHFISARRF